MKSMTLLLVVLLPPLAAAALYVAGAFTGPLQLLQPLPFTWLAASVLLWLVGSLALGWQVQGRPDARAWSGLSKAFHWLLALAILATTGLMYFIVNLGDLENDLTLRAQYSQVLQVHKSIGLAVLFLVGLRLAWNLTQRRPPLPDDMSPAVRRAAHVVHGTLYAGMIAVPLAGWSASISHGAKTRFFGLFELPAWLPKNEDWAAILQPAHIYLAWFLLGLVGVHVMAAFWHHAVRRDATLVQMLPRTPSSRS